MKKFISVFIMTICLIGCKKSPDKVAVAFLEAGAEGNTYKAMSYTTRYSRPSEREVLDIFKSVKGCRFNVAETDIYDDMAIVKIVIIEGDKARGEIRFLLVKEDGNWKIDFNYIRELRRELREKFEEAAEAIEAAGND